MNKPVARNAIGEAKSTHAVVRDVPVSLEERQVEALEAIAESFKAQNSLHTQIKAELIEIRKHLKGQSA